MGSLGFFRSLGVAKPEFQHLAEGVNIVRILRIEETDSFSQFKGTVKDELPEWSDPTPQLAITFVSAEKGKSGGITHRYNGKGNKKYDDLTDAEIASGKFENVRGYACVYNKQNQLVRVEDPEKTQMCANIINQLATALRIEESDEEGALMEGLENARIEETCVQITVVNEQYNGKDQYRVTKPKMVSLATVENDFE